MLMRSICLLLLRLGMMRRGGGQVQLPRDGGQLLRRQDEDGELGEAAVRGVGREDLVVGHLRVVDVLEAPVLEAVDGVRPPILLVCLSSSAFSAVGFIPGNRFWRSRIRFVGVENLNESCHHGRNSELPIRLK